MGSGSWMGSRLGSRLGGLGQGKKNLPVKWFSHSVE